MPFNNMNNNYQASRYIVDADGTTPFSTVQSAIDQVVTDGLTSATVLIRPGIYNETLVLVSGIDLQGSEGEVTIVGAHTPPAAGTLNLTNITFESLTDILLDAATAGTCIIRFYNCQFNLTGLNGYVFDLPNWVGDLTIESCTEVNGSNDSISFNNTSAALTIIDSFVGGGTVGANITGVTRIRNTTITCLTAVSGNAFVHINDATIDGTMTVTTPAQAEIYNSYMTTDDATACLIDDSTNHVYLGNVVMNSSAADVIDTTLIGGQQLHLGEVTFMNGSGVSGNIVTILDSYCDASNIRTLGLLNLPETNAASTKGVIYFGSDPVINAMGTDNIFAGSGAGNLALTVGSATDNVGIGANALNSLTTGTKNVAIGSAAGTNITTGSNNVLLDNAGIAAENQTIRIGTAQTANYQYGIYQASSGATKEFVFVDSNQKLSSSSLGFTQWLKTTVSLTAAVNKGYVVDMAIPGLCSILLPPASILGDVLEITGLSAAGWSITQGAGQVIHFSGVDTTPGVGGSLSSTTRYDSIKLVCTVANTEWNVLSPNGVFVIV